MTDHNDDLKPLAIEGQLPLKAVGIENLREANPQYLPPHRYLHPWFARRPTPAARLAILASVLPKGVDSDELLEWMQIGPKEEVAEDISKFVARKKATEDERSGNLEDHYGYPRPFSQSPSETQRDSLHQQLREAWNGELPSIIDPTAGGGVIPYESLRYSLPTHANELNPVPTVLLKVILEYAPDVGSLKNEVSSWGEKIDQRARNHLEEYFPTTEKEKGIDCYVSTHKIECPTCGSELPLVSKWSLRSRSDANEIYIRPELSSDGTLTYTCVKDPNNIERDDFDPSEGTVSRGGNAECLDCGVVIESEDVRERFYNGEFEYEIYAVRHIDSSGNHTFRAPNQDDIDASNAALEQIKSSYELSTFLNTPIPEGEKTSEPRKYGMNEWRDMFSPRQLLAHYEYYKSFDYYKEKIRTEYDNETADAILSILSLVPGKLIDRNSRFSPWDTTKGVPSNALGGKHLTLQKSFPEVNMATEGIGSYQSAINKIIDSYEEVVQQLPESTDGANVTSGDAADLPHDSDSIQAAVIDPPYYSSVMYAELADIFYVWMKEYLGDTFQELFDETLTDKSQEAVANPSRFESISNGDSSKKSLANDHYESKMSDIFSEIHRVLEPGGVMTVMFTHKESDAWDTLTMSLINSGFTITSTHPITSEMPARLDTQGSGSADSTLLLTGRKSRGNRKADKGTPTLWSDVEADTREAAKEAARDLLESGVSLTKTDVIISAFGPTLRVFADAYPVVDDQDEEVPPRKALETAREAVTQILVDEYLEGMDVDNLDDVTEWYILCWLVHEAETFSYDDGRQLGLGIGVNIDEIKRSTKTWRKSRGDISLRGHDGRVQNINEKPEDRSSRLPVDPDDLSFPRSLDAVHAAMHVYDKRGETETIEWLRERNFDSDSQFKATLKALLQVLPHNHEDWELARDLAVGRTSDVLDLDFSPSVFAESGDDTMQTELSEHKN